MKEYDFSKAEQGKFYCKSEELPEKDYLKAEDMMLNRAAVIREVETVPDQLLGEVFDFIEFVKAKSIREGLYTAIASESSLKKDWLCAEEDEAWGDL